MKGLSRTASWGALVVCVLAMGAAWAVVALAPRLAAAPAGRVLFVGNSLTYVGNTPALYSALAKANGKDAPSDMIVRGGAHLAQRVADGSVARALESGRYRHLVLQERGGDLSGGFGPQAGPASREAIRRLAELGRRHGVQVFLLGTYQPSPPSSRQLVEDESAAAEAAGIRYIEISETLQQLMQMYPGMDWFPPGDFHPGNDLALLNALRVYQAIHGELPPEAGLVVNAPIYASTSGLKEDLRASDAPPPLPDTPGSIEYSADTLGRLIGPLGNAP